MGQVLSGGGSRPVTIGDLQLAEQMREDLSRLPVPTLQHRDNPHEYLYFAFFDGTGQAAAVRTPPMTHPRRLVSTLALLALSACVHSGATAPSSTQEHNAMELPSQQSPIPPVVTSGELSPQGDPVISARMNFKPIEWPLRFSTFSFGARCHDTLECHIPFGRLDLGNRKPTQSSASYGPDYLEGWSGGYGGVRNFPPPVKVTWRSKDGTAHEATIDIGEIFKDERVLHYVPREEVADAPGGTYDHDPSILLEVNDRTIRVYMRAFVPTKHLQIPGNRYSDARDDLILVKTYTY